MKFSLATIALAAAVVASPTNPPTETGSCNINGKTGSVVCCNSLIPVLGQVLCNVASNSCNTGQKVKCCDTKATGIVNIVLLNCIDILS